MLAAAVLALVIVNMGGAAWYDALWRTPVVLGVGDISLLDLTLREVVNDGIMAVFFFVVALEIKGELVAGELRRLRVAALPVIAALGGMVVPAVIYAAVNGGGTGASGWGVPMATDIAFAVAVLTVLGDRVPAAARVFLLTLAVVDDLGAIVVIAVFYNGGLDLAWIAGFLGVVITAFALRRMHVRSFGPYLVLAVLAWFTLAHSGVHPTIAGVVLGLLTPAEAFFEPGYVTHFTRRVALGLPPSPDPLAPHLGAEVQRLRRVLTEAEAPMHRLTRVLTPWVQLGILPLFAFVNAGMALPANLLTAWAQHPVSLGVTCGLLVGKPLGVFGACRLACALRVAERPRGTSWTQMFGVACCAGIGFTVAMFMAAIAFDSQSLVYLAHLGIMSGSCAAGVTGYLLLRLATPRKEVGR